MLSYNKTLRAYKECRKRKVKTKAHVDFHQNLERNLVSLTQRVNNFDYQPDAARVFAVTSPKPREVWAAQFHDRVVHHLIYNEILDRFHRRFIDDTYACLPGRGVLYGVGRVDRFIRQASENYTKDCWVLQADLSNFFVSIDRNILEDLTFAYVKEPLLRHLLATVIHHDVASHYVISGDPANLSLVPKYKSLFYAPKDKGLPIGNLTSQLLANVYLNPLDQFVKHELKIRYYGRYVDDIILVGRDPYSLQEAFEYIKEFANTTLKLEFHPNKTKLYPIEQGVDFCGYELRKYHRLLRQRTLQSLKKRARAYEDIDNLEQLITWSQSMNSYLGILKHANSQNFKNSLVSRYDFDLDVNLEKVVVD